MTGSIELDQDGQHLVIRFDYDEFLVQEVRALPERRWDKRQRCWRVPASHAELVAGAFMKHGFELSSEVTAVIAGTRPVTPTAAPAARQDSDADAQAPAPGALSVSQLNERARSALLAAFPGRVQVIGEVVEFDKNRARKHVFFRLVEKSATDDRLTATVDVAMFERTLQRVLPALEAKGLSLGDGIEILVDARVDLYPATGRYQLVIEDIHPEFTLGKLAMSRELIVAKLRAAGVFERNQALPLPTPTLRIGVLTSPDSDGWNDFLHQLQASSIGFDLTLVPVRVQGQELEPTVLSGLRWFADRAADFDVLCIVRGGGSKTDLAWFDNLKVAFAVAEHPLKILCGIGHERDRSVLDEITTSMKTPTAVAAFLIDQWRDTDRRLGEAAARLVELATAAVERERGWLRDGAARLARHVRARVSDQQQRLGVAVPRLIRGSAGLLRTEQRRLLHAAQRTQLAPRGRIAAERRDLEHRSARLGERVAHRLQRAGARLDLAAARQRLLDPRRILERGYALVRDRESGAIVTDVARLSTAQRADVQLRDGVARVRIDEIEPHPPRDSAPPDSAPTDSAAS